MARAWTIVRLESTDSTNEEAWRRQVVAPDGLVVVAGRQTAGRGRFGRRWYSPEGGLWMSLLLRPSLPAERTVLVTVATALAMRQAVQDLGLPEARIRFPNDVVVRDRKICGILAESRQPGVLVVGVGLNVNVPSFPQDVPEATSLSRELGRPVPLKQAERASLDALSRWLDRLDDEAALAEAWRRYSAVRGRAVVLHDGPHPREGVVVDLDPLLGLILRQPDGTLVHLPAEHVADLRPL